MFQTEFAWTIAGALRDEKKSRKTDDPQMELNEFREQAYGTYVSGFKSLTTASHVGNSRGAVRYRKYLRVRLDRWLRALPRSAVIADIGCGDGMLLQVFKEMGFSNLSGVDGSPEMAALSRNHFPSVETGDLRVFLQRHPDSFNLISMFDVLEHFTRPEAIQVLRSIHAALREDGYLLLQLPNGDSPFAGAVFCGDVTHEALYTTTSLAHLCSMAGFTVIAAEEHSPAVLDFKSGVRAFFWQFVRSVICCCHYAETGGPSTGIYTRVMRVLARKHSVEPCADSVQ